MFSVEINVLILRIGVFHDQQILLYQQKTNFIVNAHTI